MPLPESVPRAVWAARIAGGDARIQALTALAGRSAIGFVRLDLAPDRSAELTLIIDPRHRRRGGGCALVEKALDEARRLGLRRLCALVRPDNEPALRLFADCGFESTATRVVGFVHLARVVHRADRESPLEIVP